jgi:hypothetical protein
MKTKVEYLFFFSLLTGIVLGSGQEWAPYVFPELAFSKIIMFASGLVFGGTLMGLVVIFTKVTSPYVTQFLWCRAIRHQWIWLIKILMN